MKTTDLPSEVIQRIRELRYDYSIEKHEGPFDWDMHFKYGDVPDPIKSEGQFILLPTDAERIRHISVIRRIDSTEGKSMMLFLMDRWLGTQYPDYKEDNEHFWAGRFAFCERVSELAPALYVATVYHEWYVTPLVNGGWPDGVHKPGWAK